MKKKKKLCWGCYDKNSPLPPKKNFLQLIACGVASAEEVCNYCAQCKVFLLLVHLLNKHAGLPMIPLASVFSFLCRFCLFLQEPLCSDSKATPNLLPPGVTGHIPTTTTPFSFVTDCFLSWRHVDALKSVMSGFVRGSFIFYSAAEPHFFCALLSFGLSVKKAK